MCAAAESFRPLILNLRDYGGRSPRRTKRVDRNTPFGNPFHIGEGMTREQAIAAFAAWVETQPALIVRARQELSGFHLACWCAPKPCHAEVWRRLLYG